MININYLPRADNFFVLIIFEANSRPVAFCTQRRTTENAPLENKKEIIVPKIKNGNAQMFVTFALVGTS